MKTTVSGELVSPVQHLREVESMQMQPMEKQTEYITAKSTGVSYENEARKNQEAIILREWRKDLEHGRKIDLLQTKTACEIEKKQAVAELKQQRELAITNIAMLGDGFIYELVMIGSNVSGGKLVCFAKNLQLTKFYACGRPETIFWLNWEDDFVIIKGESFCPAELRKQLLQRGIAIHASRNNMQSLTEHFFAYLIRNQVKTELPWSTGWNRVSNGIWRFVKQGEENLKEMLNYEK